MALMYTFAVLFVIAVVGIIWTQHELNKPGQAE